MPVLPSASLTRPTMTSLKRLFLIFLLFLAVLLGFIIRMQINNGIKDSDDVVTSSRSSRKSNPSMQNDNHIHHKEAKNQSVSEIHFSCEVKNQKQACSSNLNQNSPPLEDEPVACPGFFRWIQDDLRPWKASRISKEMVERGKPMADFRLVILNGRAYIESYRKSFQTRDIYTQWGILQLLRRYPGQVPDLDLMFNCGDKPIVKAGDYMEEPPPVFRYCKDNNTLDIVFPDWSFWGWPEINIKPWEALLKELENAGKKVKWEDRQPFAFWKGNPSTSSYRRDLLRCNVSKTKEWNARIFAQLNSEGYDVIQIQKTKKLNVQDWDAERRLEFRNSDLARQCDYRYKIYMEGVAWSVSLKYILACDSLTLMEKSQYHDFFSRGLMPLLHYWPIKNEELCKSIKLAVDWGNTHKQQAQIIGKAASYFMHKGLKMDFVYDYMLHVLKEYADLLNYQPSIPPNAVEYCSEAMACPARGLEKEYMMESFVKFPKNSSPCKLAHPFHLNTIPALVQEQENLINKESGGGGN
ncbi:hypothetical protein H6P81_017028 [Aristolochia fimbriata]|uniref:Glycosyl transferase CAP10 domain-containing protein n=1 Tax=Aristolochia fimbriata TaxID=158543 RepID=A0AAV7DYU6_ARIFI|nr:hypothetical protein H6P81_017028 [Aristolochia fimbriata]